MWSAMMEALQEVTEEPAPVRYYSSANRRSQKPTQEVTEEPAPVRYYSSANRRSRKPTQEVTEEPAPVRYYSSANRRSRKPTQEVTHEEPAPVRYYSSAKGSSRKPTQEVTEEPAPKPANRRSQKPRKAKQAPADEVPRINAILLTYEGHVSKALITDHFQRLFDKQESSPTALEFLRIAHETGGRTVTYPHTHVVARWSDFIILTSQNIFDLPLRRDNVYYVNHPHWSIIKDRTHWNNSVRYLAKEDVSNNDLIDYES